MHPACQLEGVEDKIKNVFKIYLKDLVKILGILNPQRSPKALERIKD